MARPARLWRELPREPLVHVLVTADTLSGVWTYTRELVTGLVSRGVRVTLVSLGEIPFPDQTSWMDNLHGLEYRPTAFRLDWMQEGEQDLKDSSAYLVALTQELKPDLLHLNHMCYGSLPVNVPRVVVAHGDLISWWKAVHGHSPKESRWLNWYREAVTRGLAKASAVVSPSRWMLETIRSCYTRPRLDTVIYNGRNPIFFNPYVSKDDSVLAVGRLWDAGKQVSLLTQHTHPLPVCIVGTDAPVQSPRLPIRADVKLNTDSACVALKGPQTEGQLRNLYSRASVFAATSRYEPFGMAAVEAALSRCVIVANDIPSYREIWDDAALYFHANDAASLALTIRRLSEEPDLCRNYATRAYQRARERFTAKRMIDEYLQLYTGLLETQAAVA
ncbi:MAG: glycosyltransferase family 4 protein [Acidobacteriia bacterium]|nr:glycosyltransferase family 4 protein [Terriglobia bacterium]